MVNQRMFLFQGEDLRWFETQSETQTSKNIAIAYHQLRPGSVVLSTECYGRPGPRQFGVLNNPRNVPSDGLKNSHIYEVLTGGVVRFYIDCDWYRNGHESYNADLPDDDELVLGPLVNGMNKALQQLGHTELDVTMLEACSDQKASYHIMWKHVWFRDQNTHVKNFLLDTLATWQESVPFYGRS